MAIVKSMIAPKVNRGISINTKSISPERVRYERDRFANQMIHNLKKTNPPMANAVALQYERGSWDRGSDGRGMLNPSGNVYYLNGLHELGFDWGGLINNAAQSVISVGTQYAGAAAQAKLNEQAANNAAKLATKQIEAQNKADALKAQNVNSDQARQSALYKESLLDTSRHVVSDTPMYLWFALAAAVGTGIYVFVIKPRGKKKK